MTDQENIEGFFDRSRVSRLEIQGADRVRFLNGRITCDVGPLAPDEGAFGFLPQVKGRILADVKVLALEASLWLELPPGKGEEMAQHLGKYIIVEDVTIQPLEQVPISVVGHRATEFLGQGEQLEAPLSHRLIELFGTEIRLVREIDIGAPGSEVPVWTVWAPASESSSLEQKLIVAGGLQPVEVETWERLRIEAGQPLYGQDYGEDNFPQETGLDDAVSYTKGCYLGQEVIARIHYRGGVNKHLRGLCFEDGGRNDQGAGDNPVSKAVHEGGREAGKVTSYAFSKVLGPIGLAVLHKRVEPGAEVEIEGGGAARVTTLPFTTP